MNTRSTLFYILAVCLLLGGADTATAGYGLILTVPPALAHRDVTPDPFSFNPRNNVAKGVPVRSNPVIVTGFNRVLPVEFDSPCYVSVDDGPRQSSWHNEVKVHEGQKITVIIWSSNYNGIRKSCTVKIGETASTFTVTTAIPPPVKTCASGPQTVEWKGETWQRCDNGWDYSDPYAEPEKIRAYCDNLNLGGYYDWELPSPWQLATLIACDNGNTPPPYKVWSGTLGCAYDNDGNYYGPYSSPTIDPVFQAEPTPYWSWFDDISPGPGFYPVYVKHDFATGAQGYTGPYDAGKIRCVRRHYP